MKRLPSIEQYFFLFTKAAIFASGIVLLSAVIRKQDRNLLRDNLFPVILIIMFMISRMNTLGNFSAYFVLVFAFVGLHLVSPRRKWLAVLLCMLLFVQITRVASFPARHMAEFTTGLANLKSVGVGLFYGGAETDRLLSVAETVKRYQIKEAVVIGRSPEIYFLFGLQNPSRYDVAIPLYLNKEQVQDVIEVMRQTTVIYDRTFEKLSQTSDFYDVHHYRSGDGLKPEISNSPLLRQMDSMQKIYSDPYVEILIPISRQ